MSDNIAISVNNLHKNFRLPREKSSSIKQALIATLHSKKGYSVQKVLRGITFDIHKGDFIGIVGRNGSGKSTLLKALAQIYQPEKGTVHVNGSLIPFIELGVGFNPELTGRENVYMNGALFGLSNTDMDELYSEIVEFAELERFMDQKLKNYSSGMQVRLAFSIAIRANADILLLDEILAVGDEAFQRKCYTHFAQLKKDKKTVILVTHSMEQVQQFCNKAIFIEDGKIAKIGNPAKVATAYREANSESIKRPNKDRAQTNEYLKVNTSSTLSPRHIAINVELFPTDNLEDIVVTLVIIQGNGEWAYRFATDEKIKQRISLTKGKPQKLHLELDNIFCNGVFSVQVGVKSRDRSREYIIVDDATGFEVVNGGSYPNDVYWKPKERVRYE